MYMYAGNVYLASCERAGHALQVKITPHGTGTMDLMAPSK